MTSFPEPDAHADATAPPGPSSGRGKIDPTMPLADQIGAFEAEHARLQAALADIDQPDRT